MRLGAEWGWLIRRGTCPAPQGPLSPDPCRGCAPLVHRGPYRRGPQLIAIGHNSCVCPISKDRASFPNRTPGAPAATHTRASAACHSREAVVHHSLGHHPLMTWHQVTQSQLSIKAEGEPNMKGSGQEMPPSFKAGVKREGRA